MLHQQSRARVHSEPGKVCSSLPEGSVMGLPKAGTQKQQAQFEPACAGSMENTPAITAMKASSANPATVMPPTTAVPHAAAEISPILCEQYRGLARHHLRTLPALFTKFTGLFSHLAWAPTWPGRWSAHSLPTRSRLCRQVVGGYPDTLADCRRCAARHLDLALKSGHDGHQFTCFLGVHNFWLPVIVRGCLVGLAFVQALAPSAAGATFGQGPMPANPAAAASAAARASCSSRRGARRMSRRDFGKAAKLLQLVFQHVETSALAELRKSDLSRAQQALLELQTVATRLRTELNGLVPALNKNTPVLEAENHSERLVHGMLDYIHRHYSEPFTLQQYAGRLRMNAAYLSAQFSRAVGMPFKTYLTEMRVEKARELLSDPARSVAEVAYAVGYASENRFRLAFKRATGLSPRRWRETLRMEPSATS
jgi:AraC-like DNA-binding protein